MELKKSQQNLAFVGCVMLVLVIQLANSGLSNILGIVLTRMDAMQYYSIQAALSGLVMAVMTPIGGRLGDILGRKLVSLIGASIFCLGAFLTAAPTFPVFLAGRLLLGAGQGMFLSIPFALCADIFPKEVYAKKVGMLQAVLALGIVCGATIAGSLQEIGLTTVAIAYPGVLAVVGALLIYFQLPNRKVENKAPMDVRGIVFVSLFTASLSLSFSFAGQLGFGNPVIILGFAAAIVFFIVLYRAENKKEAPFIPFQLFKNLKFTGVCLFTGLLACNQTVMSLYVPLTGQQIMGLASTVTGLFTLPRSILCIILPSFAAAWVTKGQGRLRQAHMISSMAVVLAFIGMALVSSGSPVWMPFVFLAFTGISEAFRAVSSNPMLVSLLKPEDIGIGIALNSTMGTLLSTISISILSAIYTPVAAINLPRALWLMYVIVAAMAFAAFLTAALMLKDRDGK